MGNDTPLIGKNSRRQMFGEGTPLGDDTYQGGMDLIDPLHLFHDTPGPGDSFNDQVARKGAGQGGILTDPSAQAGAEAGVQDTLSRERRIRSASTILTSGAGLLDEPNTYSASRSLIGN